MSPTLVRGHNFGTMPADTTIATQIIDFIRNEGLAPGAHLPAQLLAAPLAQCRLQTAWRLASDCNVVSTFRCESLTSAPSESPHPAGSPRH